jgi:hypothetical protein
MCVINSMPLNRLLPPTVPIFCDVAIPKARYQLPWLQVLDNMKISASAAQARAPILLTSASFSVRGAVENHLNCWFTDRS